MEVPSCMESLLAYVGTCLPSSEVSLFSWESSLLSRRAPHSIRAVFTYVVSCMQSNRISAPSLPLFGCPKILS